MDHVRPQHQREHKIPSARFVCSDPRCPECLLVFLTSLHEHRLLHGPAEPALKASHFAAGDYGKAIPRSKRIRLRWQYGGHLTRGISTRTQDTRASTEQMLQTVDSRLKDCTGVTGHWGCLFGTKQAKSHPFWCGPLPGSQSFPQT